MVCFKNRLLFLIVCAIAASLVSPCEGRAEDLFIEGAPQLSAGEATLPDFSKLAAALSKSVVNISVEGGEQEGEVLTIPGLPFQFRQPEPQRSLGSGVIVSKRGHIITNNHVIGEAAKIIVRLLDDKKEYVAEVIGKDPKTDIALLKIDHSGDLEPAFFGNSDDVQVGEWVMAIGNQFQLGQTVTSGIVSAKSRRVPTRGANNPYDDFIQTDASINPGSSGGPLFNASGQVIGINTAIYSPGKTQYGGTGFNIGIGFATPANLVREIAEQLFSKGKVIRGWLGVIIQPVTPEVGEALGLANLDGALVADVLKGSPASKAGFRRGDVIVQFNGTAVKENSDLPLLVAGTPVNKAVEVVVFRKGARKVLSTVIGELTDSSLELQAEANQEPEVDKLGVLAQDITPEMVKSLELDSDSGVIVGHVAPGSIAESSGLARGDIILEVGDTVISDVGSYRKALVQYAGKKPVLVLVRRKQGTRYLTMSIPQ